jgi:putative hydrolase of the HAD superfamily
MSGRTVSFVWFDVGYTLLYMQREKTYQQALRECGHDVPLADIEREFHLTDKLFMREFPGIFLGARQEYMPKYLGILNDRLGLNADIHDLDLRWEHLKRNTANYWLPFSGVSEVLAELKKRSIRLGIISNWDQTARDVLRASGLIDFFDHLVISCEVDCVKPDKRIFEIALGMAAVSAHDCIHIGDNYYDDALGSRKVGMDALIINRFGRLGVEEITDCTIIQRLSDLFDYIQDRNEKQS